MSGLEFLKIIFYLSNGQTDHWIKISWVDDTHSWRLQNFKIIH